MSKASALLAAVLMSGSCASHSTTTAAPAPATPGEMRAAHENLNAVVWMQTSIEYEAAALQAYRTAQSQLEAALKDASWTAAIEQTGDFAKLPPAVVLDIDETVLDNSTYELDRATYGLSFENRSWNSWVEREEAGVVPGAIEFISGIRRLGGRVAFITNRDEVTRQATIANLRRFNLWTENDRLCLATDSTYPKRMRRQEVADGRGNCSWNGTPTPVVVFVGDQMGDFPATGESDADAGSFEAWGKRYFILPNPMYGNWTTRVTRQR